LLRILGSVPLVLSPTKDSAKCLSEEFLNHMNHL
jgi:hypothetical protein